MIQRLAPDSLVLVTGATGFIGRGLCAYLLERGHSVRGTHRGNSSPDLLSDSIEWVKIEDIGPDTDWAKALNGVDYVVHLSALAHQLCRKRQNRIAEFMRVNLQATRRLAQAVAASNRVSRLVFISSAGAVRSLSSETLTKTTPPKPDTPYGLSKYKAELAVQEVMRSCRADWCILRPPLVYGPGNPGNMARLLKLISMGLPLPFGSIRNERSLIYLGNLVDLIEKCLSHPNAGRRIFFASDEKDVSTPELILHLGKYSKKPVRMFGAPVSLLKLLGQMGNAIEFLTGRSSGIDSYSVDRLIGSLRVDSSDVCNSINWLPPFTFEEGIRRTVNAAIL